MKHQDLSWDEKEVRRWITKRRGILTKIAVAMHVSPQFVQALAYGRGTTRPGHEVEAALREAGWPGITKRG
jgi:hypothetical protein